MVPVLSVDQIGSEAGQAAAVAAHRCIVPIFGAQDADLRGLDPKPTRPLEDKLSAINAHPEVKAEEFWETVKFLHESLTGQSDMRIWPDRDNPRIARHP